jgi:two-component system, cell cycle response regulator DivK
MDNVHVLMVEDEPLNIVLARAMLGTLGIQNVYVATSGEELPKVLAEIQRVDLVLLDLQLPGDDGFVLLHRLRNEEKLKDTPILAVSAQVLPEIIRRVEHEGFDGFIGKPLRFDKFGSNIRRALNGERIWEWQ